MAKGLNAVFTQAGVEFALVYSKSRREADQRGPKDSSKKSRKQESADASDENSGPHLRSNPKAVELVYRASWTCLDGNGRAQVERVAALYREEPRPVRVVAYTSPPMPGAPGGEPLGSYHAALARAQAVADALRAAGIPADRVQAEAAPAASYAAADRVDIQFAP